MFFHTFATAFIANIKPLIFFSPSILFHSVSPFYNNNSFSITISTSLGNLKNPISLTSDTLILVILSSLIKGSALAFNTSTLLAIKLFLITLSIYTLANLKCYPSPIF